jgi:hypothetical protein
MRLQKDKAPHGRGWCYAFGVLGEIEQWLISHPTARTALMLSLVFCFWEFVAQMRARDMRLLADRRAADQRRADERAAAISERVSKLRGTSGPSQ